MTANKYTRIVKEEAHRLGFSYCGISKAEFLHEEAPRLEHWLKKNMHGQMKYMEQYFDQRLNPTLLLHNAKSVISLLLNYYPPEMQNPQAPKISKYAYGKDYHRVIKKKLRQLLNVLRERIGAINGRAFVDSAPVMDKVWAKKSGLGWIGKHSNLLNKQEGSFFFIAELIVDIELEYDGPVKDYCGTCTRCIEACPTGAITEPYIVDGSRCIAYFTIELKEQIPESVKGKFNDWIFGCDICQDVCPWNRFARPHQEPMLMPNEQLLKMNRKDWEEMTEDVFNQTFSGSPLKRAKYKGVRRNLAFIRKPNQTPHE